MSDLDDDISKQIKALADTEKALSNLADAVTKYYQMLIDRGMSEDQAFKLSAMWQESMLNAIMKKGDK